MTDRAERPTILKGAAMTPRDFPNEALLGGTGLPQDLQSLIVNAGKSDADALALAIAFNNLSQREKDQAVAFQLVLIRRDITDGNREVQQLRSEYETLHSEHVSAMKGAESCRGLDRANGRITGMKRQIAGYVAVGAFVFSALWAIAFAVLQKHFLGDGK